MKKIDLSKLKVYKDLSRTEYVFCDGTKEIANFIYLNGNGLKDLALALKLYDSNGPIELNKEEEELLIENVNKLSPCAIEAVNKRIEEAATEAE